jgi:hypothetical protein
MNGSRFDILEYLASEKFDEATKDAFIESIAHRLNRPGADGRASRRFLLDWMYLQRPMIERFRGETLSAQFLGPAVEEQGREYPVGGYILNGVDWSELSPLEALDLYVRLQEATDAVIENWMSGPRTFLPALPEKRAEDADEIWQGAAQAVRDLLGQRPDKADDKP